MTSQDTSSRYTQWFGNLRITDRPTVGGKCASLGELVHAGIDVPDGFAVTVEAFEIFRETGTLRDDLKAIVRAADPTNSAALDVAHERATEMVCAAPFPETVGEQIRADYRELCSRLGNDELPVAVRSSAVAEDGDAASFAGQQETYLWVVGADSVVDHVRQCWASLYTPQAIAYRTKLPEDQAYEATRISVAVQAMVDARVAGVAFTVSPRTGDRSVVAINASWGLGHAVVSGEVTPDEYWLSKAGPVITSQVVAHKATRCVPDKSGQGVVNEPVPHDQQDVPCLDEAQVIELTELALRVEDHYGGPQDIEWALTSVGGTSHFVLLQSRPETSWKAARAAATKARKSSAGGYLNFVQSAAAKRTGA